MSPTYFGHLRSNPGYDRDFASADDLKKAVHDGAIYYAFVRAFRPGGGTHIHHELSLPLDTVRDLPAGDLDRYVINRLAEQLLDDFHPKYCISQSPAN